MQAFTLTQPRDIQTAIAAASQAGSKYIAGGTDLLQLAKDNVETPERLVDLEVLNASRIHAGRDRLRLEPLARMSDVAAHPEVATRWPVLSQALLASASPQVRNMATMGGKLVAAHTVRVFPRHRLRLQQASARLRLSRDQR